MLLKHMLVNETDGFTCVGVVFVLYRGQGTYSTASYSCRVWLRAQHLCLLLIDWFPLNHWLLLHFATLAIVKLDSCLFFTNAPRAEELLGKSCVRHKAALIAFHSAVPFKRSLVSLQLYLKRTLLAGVPVPFSNMWALCQLLSLLHKRNKSLPCSKRRGHGKRWYYSSIRSWSKCWGACKGERVGFAAGHGEHIKSPFRWSLITVS